MKLLNWLRSDAFLRKQLGEAHKKIDLYEVVTKELLKVYRRAVDENKPLKEEVEMLKEKLELSKKQRMENHPSI